MKGKLDNVKVSLVSVFVTPDCDEPFFRLLFNVIAVETESSSSGFKPAGRGGGFGQRAGQSFTSSLLEEMRRS